MNGTSYDLSTTELCLTNPSAGGDLAFSLVTADQIETFKIEFFVNQTSEPAYPDYRIIQLSGGQVEVHYGTKMVTAVKFLQDFTPTIWFADGSALTGNEYVELKQSIPLYPKEKIIAWDWTGVNLSAESQHVAPKITDSIQFKVIEVLKNEDFDIIYDDDYSGEIADVVAIKLHTERILVHLYHLKYALEGVVSNQIKNLYEVCGQAQKSIHWKHKKGTEFVNHLLRRETKTKNGLTCSRLEKGTVRELEKLLSIAKKEIPMEFQIFLVQPGISKAQATPEILTLLSVTENFIKEMAAIHLTVITSD